MQDCSRTQLPAPRSFPVSFTYVNLNTDRIKSDECKHKNPNFQSVPYSKQWVHFTVSTYIHRPKTPAPLNKITKAQIHWCFHIPALNSGKDDRRNRRRQKSILLSKSQMKEMPLNSRINLTLIV